MYGVCRPVYPGGESIVSEPAQGLVLRGFFFEG